MNTQPVQQESLLSRIMDSVDELKSLGKKISIQDIVGRNYITIDGNGFTVSIEIESIISVDGNNTTTDFKTRDSFYTIYKQIDYTSIHSFNH